MIVVAVSAARHWMPMWPSPPAPISTQVVPGYSSGIALRTAWYAVMPASASAATSFGCVFGSSFTQARAEVSRYSAIPPSLSRPGKVLTAQCMSSPARQAWQSPQVGVGCRITVSPTCTLVTAAPISCTQPAFSWPIV